MHIFSGKHKHRTLQTPKGDQTRPTSGRLREAIFNICQMYIQEARFLDLFAGSGAVGLEALSRGAKQVAFVDNSKESVRCIHDNIAHLQEEAHAEVFCLDALMALEKLQKLKRQFDIIYIDPPYGYSSNAILQIIDSSNILGEKGVLFIEEAAPSKVLTEGLKHLVLKNTRRQGKTILHQFEYLEESNP